MIEAGVQVGANWDLTGAQASSASLMKQGASTMLESGNCHHVMLQRCWA